AGADGIPQQVADQLELRPFEIGVVDQETDLDAGVVERLKPDPRITAKLKPGSAVRGDVERIENRLQKLRVRPVRVRLRELNETKMVIIDIAPQLGEQLRGAAARLAGEDAQALLVVGFGPYFPEPVPKGVQCCAV